MLQALLFAFESAKQGMFPHLPCDCRDDSRYLVMMMTMLMMAMIEYDDDDDEDDDNHDDDDDDDGESDGSYVPY